MKSDQLISFIDLTSLNETDTQDEIDTLCTQAKTPLGNVAAVCVYPQFIKQACERLNNEITVATVINFPGGDLTPAANVAMMQQALKDGAKEIDAVLPYRLLQIGHEDEVLEFIHMCRNICSDVILKIIIESGALVKEGLIAEAASLCIEGKVDFIKTSTGKMHAGASLGAVKTIANTIKKAGTTTGIKISGGVRTVEDALAYVDVVEEVLGKQWLQSSRLRIGTSKLLQDILSST